MGILWSVAMLIKTTVVLYILYLQISYKINIPNNAILLLALSSFALCCFSKKKDDHKHKYINYNVINLLVGIVAFYAYFKKIIPNMM